MANTRLRLGTDDNIGVFENIPASITYQIGDVRKPEDRKGTRSLTVTIPASQEANILFENIFQINVSLNTFNPNLKTEAVYYVDELINFEGYAQMLKINVDEKTERKSYELMLIGELTSLFTDIQGRYLTDLYSYVGGNFLSFNTYNHTLSYTTGTNNTVYNSWSNLGDSYVYPLIDWGVNNSNLTYVNVSHLKPCLFVWGYWNRIFEQAGYTYESSFIDSTFFKRLIIPPTKFAQLSSATINANKFLAEADGSQVFSKSMSYASSTVSFSETTFTTVGYQNETYDTGNKYNSGTFTFTPTVTNKYNTLGSLTLNLVLKKGALDVSGNINGQTGTITVGIFQGSSIIGQYDFNVASMSFAASNSNAASITLNNVTLTASQNYTVKIRFTNVVLGVTTGSGTYTLEATVSSGSFSSEFASNNVYEGATVDMIDIIPENVLQSDFIKSIFRMFNLYATIDKTNPKKYIIEPRNDFYYPYTSSKDWTYKHDQNSKTDIIILGELNNIKYTYTYKQDSDFLNKLHFDTYQEVYGEHEEVLTNDFIKGENKTDVIFSATPYMNNPFFGLVCPAIIKKENNVIQPHKGNIRILYWSGTINLPNTQWTLYGNAGSQTFTTFPHAGHTDNPYSPSVDISWGLPTKVYYTYPNQQWTTNNLFNKYYSKYIEQISDKNSKIVVTDFYLTPTDIQQFDFRYPIFFKDAYYLVNKIIDYNPLVKKVTRVELIKLADKDDFVEGTYEFNGGLGGVENASHERNAQQSLVLGESVNYGENSFIVGGSGNFIAQGADSITLVNCNNVIVGSDVTNFTAVNVSDLNVDSSYSNTTITGKETPITITTDTTLNAAYNNKIVYVDATAGDITLTWDCLNMEGVQVKLIRKDSSANQIFITDVGGYGTESFIGNALPYDLGLTQYEALPITSLNDTIYILS